MFQVAHDLLHGHLLLEEHPSRILQDKARHQA
jgi:hypothetical protein